MAKETVYKLPVTLKCDPAEIENGIDIEIVHKFKIGRARLTTDGGMRDRG